jgi:3',5'-cyclic AMP phosphodiesterase CpdA
MQIAHFSDVHALSLDGAELWEFLSKRVAGFINVSLRRKKKHAVWLFEGIAADLNRRPPDEVVVTGDLTNLSLQPEFRLAREILDRISLGPSHVTVIPGNHDVYTWDARVRKLFERYLAPYAGDGSEVTFPIERVRGEVAILGLSTALPSPPPLADGWVGKKQLQALEAALDRNRDKFRVLAMHHPPVTNKHAFLRGLRDRGALQKVLGRVGCELVLHGHEHRDLRTEIAGPEGPIPVIGVGSGSYSDPRPDRRARYNVYHVEGKRLLRVETRVHDPASDRFVAAA